MVKWEDVSAVYSTVQEMESLYTKVEVARAKVAYEGLKNVRYPSLEEFIHLVEDGNIHELPVISQADIR